MTRGFVKCRTQEDGLWKWAKTDLRMENDAIWIGDRRRLFDRASVWTSTPNPRGFDITLMGGEVVSCIADSGEVASAWVANINNARTKNGDLEEARTIVAELALQNSEDRGRDAETIRTLERRCETLSDQLREAESLHKELRDDANQSRANMTRSDNRAERLEERVVALSARLSAAEDRAEIARVQLERSDSKLVVLRSRLDRAQEEALRFSAEVERVEREKAELVDKVADFRSTKMRQPSLQLTARVDAPRTVVAFGTHTRPRTVSHGSAVVARKPSPSSATSFSRRRRPDSAQPLTSHNVSRSTSSATKKKKPPVPRRASTNTNRR